MIGELRLTLINSILHSKLLQNTTTGVKLTKQAMAQVETQIQRCDLSKLLIFF